MNYYNEFDPKAAAWLRELIKRNLIPNGAVDERSITEVTASDLRGFLQCHFFAGIGGWSLALQLAGWPEDKPVWTGSCPCQPFSAAGRRKGVNDARHLWPVFANLIAQCRPDCVVGEQVPTAIKHGWLDGVYADMEAEGYAVGAIVLGACAVGAPHRRQRLYWVAENTLGDTNQSRSQGWRRNELSERSRECTTWTASTPAHCRDGRIRRIPVELAFQPLVARIPTRVVRCGYNGESFNPAEARVMRLRGYGNAIVPQVAAEFIKAYLDTKE